MARQRDSRGRFVGSGSGSSSGGPIRDSRGRFVGRGGRGAGAHFVDVDMGYDRAIAALLEMDGAGVAVGIFAGAGGVGSEVANYAAANEYGTQDGRIPERSWMRSTVAENEQAYSEAMAAAAGRAIAGETSVELAFLRVGMTRVRTDLSEKITSLDSPPNAASTIARKGSSNPLVDTGLMRQSLTAEAYRRGREPQDG